MTNDDDLIVGAFYWAMPANDPDLEQEWEWYSQPVRFCGRNDQGEPLWQCIGMDGETDWAMRWIGPRIVSPRGDEDERISKGNERPLR